MRHRLGDPFFVLATQNPIEQEGTYPLPEAQQDRFMFKVFVNYPNFNEEFEVARRTTAIQTENIQAALSGQEIIELQRTVREVPVSDHIIRYALSLVRQTRVGQNGVPDFVNDQIGWGAGPRASQYLVLGAKARAAMDGRPMADLEDVKTVARQVLRHRVVTNFAAEASDRSGDDIVSELVEGKSWMS